MRARSCATRRTRSARRPRPTRLPNRAPQPVPTRARALPGSLGLWLDRTRFACINVATLKTQVNQRTKTSAYENGRLWGRTLEFSRRRRRSAGTTGWASRFQCAQELGMLDGNLQQRACGTCRFSAPLFPVLKRSRRNTQQLRELLLRQADTGPRFGRCRQLDLRDAHSSAAPHLLNRSQQIILKFLNFRSHLQPPSSIARGTTRASCRTSPSHRRSTATPCLLAPKSR